MGNIIFRLPQIIRFQRFIAVFTSMLLTFSFSTLASAASGSLETGGLYDSKEAIPATLQQQRKITGAVVDSKGEPLIGVSIKEKGTSNATVTDFNGRFELSVNNADTQLIVSYVGFVSQTLKAQSKMRIVLKEDVKDWARS